MFSELLPLTLSRAVSIGSLAIALACISYGLKDDRPTQIAASLFIVSCSVGWWQASSSDDATAHFTNLTLGLCVMSCCGLIGRSVTGRCLALRAVVLLGTVFILVGLVTTQFTPDKLIRVGLAVVAKPFDWLPSLDLRLPGVPEVWTPTTPRYQVNPNALAVVGLMTFFPSVALLTFRPEARRSAVGLLGASLSLAAIVVSLSRGAMLSFLVTALLFTGSTLTNRLRAYLSVAFFSALCVITIAVGRPIPDADLLSGGAVDSLSLRFSVWLDAVDQWRRSPFIGIGLNSFHSSPSVATTHTPSGVLYVSHAHNAVLQILLDVGLLGLVSYLVMLIRAVKICDIATHRAGKEARLSLLLATVVAVHLFGSLDTLALGAKVGLLFWAQLGLIISQISDYQSRMSVSHVVAADTCSEA